MWLIDKLAEERIAAALRRGDLDDLPGRGKPLVLADDSGVPEELRAAYRLLRNAGCLPPVLLLQREIDSVETLLLQAETAVERTLAGRRLGLLKARLAMTRNTNLACAEAAYRQRLLQKLDRPKPDD